MDLALLHGLACHMLAQRTAHMQRLPAAGMPGSCCWGQHPSLAQASSTPSFVAAVFQAHAASVAELEGLIRGAVGALQEVGAPSCWTLLVSDAAKTRVAEERVYYTT